MPLPTPDSYCASTQTRPASASTATYHPYPAPPVQVHPSSAARHTYRRHPHCGPYGQYPPTPPQSFFPATPYLGSDENRYRALDNHRTSHRQSPESHASSLPLPSSTQLQYRPSHSHWDRRCAVFWQESSVQTLVAHAPRKTLQPALQPLPHIESDFA